RLLKRPKQPSTTSVRTSAVAKACGRGTRWPASGLGSERGCRYASPGCVAAWSGSASWPGAAHGAPDPLDWVVVRRVAGAVQQADACVGAQPALDRPA